MHVTVQLITPSYAFNVQRHIPISRMNSEQGYRRKVVRGTDFGQDLEHVTFCGGASLC